MRAGAAGWGCWVSGETGPESHPGLGQPKDLKGPDVTQPEHWENTGKTQNRSKSPWKEGSGWQESPEQIREQQHSSDSLPSGGVRPAMDLAPASLRVIVSAFPHAYTVEMY